MPQKRSQTTLRQKFDIINKVEKENCSYGQIRREYKIAKSTISRIIKSKAEIISSYLDACSTKKKGHEQENIKMLKKQLLSGSKMLEAKVSQYLGQY